MKKVKLIYILSHVPLNVHEFKKAEEYFVSPSLGSYHKLDYPPFWVGFYAQDHHIFAAKDLMEITDEFEVECWRPYGYGLKEPHEEIVDGIKHKIFPAYTINIPQFGSLTWSNTLFDSLLREIKNNNIIINLSVGHAWFHIKLMIQLRKYKNKFGLVAIHRSGGFRKFSYKKLDSWKKLFKWYYLLESSIDQYSLKFSDIYYVGAMPEYNYLKSTNGKINSSFLMEGINFDNYKVLSRQEKEKLRHQLGLPIEKKILIAYGNWKSKDYAYQHLLEVFRELKKEKNGADLELVMIGGLKTQDLYQVGVQSGAIMIERTDKKTFIKYLEASDFFTQACFSWAFINFGGFGTAMIEALACGLPVISGNIIHFPGTQEEVKKIGLNMTDKESLKRNIIFMKNNLNLYSECREIAKKYYDINLTRQILLNKYRELALKYFGIDTSK